MGTLAQRSSEGANMTNENSSITHCHHWSEQTGFSAKGFGVVLLTRIPPCPWCAIEQLHAAVKTAQELAATRLLEVERLRAALERISDYRKLDDEEALAKIARAALVGQGEPLLQHPSDGWRCVTCGHENTRMALQCQNQQCPVLNRGVSHG